MRSFLIKIYHLLGLEKPTLQMQIRDRGGKVGIGAFIGSGVLIDLDFAFLLELGKGSVVASNCIIEMHDSSLPNVLGKGKLKVGRVIIEDNAYIGVSSTILPGIVIGKGALIGANSLVNKSVPSGEVWAGVPIRYICKVSALAQKRLLENNPLCFEIDWIGEVEKLGIDYSKYKREMQSSVKYYFKENI